MITRCKDPDCHYSPVEHGHTSAQSPRDLPPELSDLKLTIAWCIIAFCVVILAVGVRVWLV